MNTSSRVYRNWTLEEWCAHVRSLGVKTLTGWARASRSAYNHAVTLGCQRDVARALGWLPRLENGALDQIDDTEFVDRFRAMDVRSITDMWKGAQYWCEYLRRAGRLERVAEALGFGYVIERHPPNLDYYLERCERVGDLTAWCLLDKNAAAAARKFGLMDELRKCAPQRPRQGYPTAGGFCRSLPELAVARLLEANGVSFVTQLDYPFTFPRGRRQRCKTDFYLSQEGAFVEVWSMLPDDTSTYWESSQVRRRFKTSLCRKLNLRLLEIEGHLLFRHGPDAFLAHTAAVLSSGGVRIESNVDRWSALDPKASSREATSATDPLSRSRSSRKSPGA